jgi:DNA-binding transcriptional ArsR family regulator
MSRRTGKKGPGAARADSSQQRFSDLDVIWKALADETRRSILDALCDGPKTTTQIVERFPKLSRFGVMKHLQVLRDASLVLSREEGRRCVNSLNAVPIRLIYDRWVSKFSEHWATTLIGLKTALENQPAGDL